MNLNNNEQEIPEVQVEEYALKMDAKDFACAGQRLQQNHTEENLVALHRELFLLGRELGLMLNQGKILTPNMKYRRKKCILESFQLRD